jgi:hypothetical protein
MFCHLTPGQALVTKVDDSIGGGGMCGSAASHGDAGTTQLIPDRARREAQLGTDLAQGPVLGVQVSCTLNVHCATVTKLRLIGPCAGLDRGTARTRVLPAGWPIMVRGSRSGVYVDRGVD